VDEEETDYEFYRRRAAEELAKSREAADHGLAAKHRQLSTIYTSRALQAERQLEIDDRDGRGTEEDGAGRDRIWPD
jgi:hypothetical protein